MMPARSDKGAQWLQSGFFVWWTLSHTDHSYVVGFFQFEAGSYNVKFAAQFFALGFPIPSSRHQRGKIRHSRAAEPKPQRKQRRGGSAWPRLVAVLAAATPHRVTYVQHDENMNRKYFEDERMHEFLSSNPTPRL